MPEPPIVTDAERKTVESLQRLARRWPRTLYLASMGGSLCVMRKGRDGEHVMRRDDSLDQDYILATIDIENTGGDW